MTAFMELSKFEQAGDYERALKQCNRIIQMEPQVFLGYQCKVTCQINLWMFAEALQVINKVINPSMEGYSKLSFEKAYCLYRLNRPQEALEEVKHSEKSDICTMELKAQVLYRLEHYDECFDLYEEIIKNVDDDYADERETNLAAAAAFSSPKVAFERVLKNLRQDTYELCFNKACALTMRGYCSEGEKLYKQCEKLCRDMYDEDEEELEKELAHLRVQWAFFYQDRGQVKEAQKIYNDILKLKLDDPALVAVASNNAVVINRDQNIFDSKKKMRVCTNDALVHKLPSRQRKFIALNAAILAHYSHQPDHCAKLSAAIERDWPDLFVQAKTLQALSLVARDKTRDAVQVLRDATAQSASPQDHLQLQLICLHLLLAQGDKEQACILIEGMGSNAYRPGIIGALITLYMSMGKEDTALKVFEETVEWFKQKKSGAQDTSLSQLWRQAAEFHLRNGRAKVAANSLEQLLESDDSDDRARANLIIAYGQVIHQSDSEASGDAGESSLRALMTACATRLLTSVSDLAAVRKVTDAERDELESGAWLTAKKSAVVGGSKDLSPGSNQDAQSKKKRRKSCKRKGKLPKNYEAGATVDPERWLPKYERTGFRKKRDRRMKDIIKGSQGTASGQSEQFDFTKVVEQHKEADESPSAEAASPSARLHYQRKGGQQPKKKNKRR